MMKRFRGTYEHTLDAKGRVAVPKKFREELLGLREDYVGAELVVTYGLSGQLFVFSPEGFDDFAARYGALPGGDVDLLDRFF
ncbi:MAG: division/cell wall cluster transcriptional repressor MraZ, partial [Proteobacteria bacterium]|nr:division/cell wall cluster transcriptional repressor MraZ [Pseudomonadota bacterium]